MHHGANIPLAHFLLVIGVAEEGKGNPVSAQGRLDDIGDVALVCFLIVVFKALAAGVLVLGQVEVGAVAMPEFAPPKGKRTSVGGGLE